MGLGPRRRSAGQSPSYYRHRPRDIPANEEERELIQAMARWMKANRCKFPAFTDVLRVLQSLGWRKE